jgi:hypothetical protein
MVAMVLAVTAWYLQSGQRLRNRVDQARADAPAERQ